MPKNECTNRFKKDRKKGKKQGKNPKRLGEVVQKPKRQEILSASITISIGAKEDINDFVAKSKTRVSAYLTAGLCSSLLACGIWHADRVGYITHQMLSPSSSINTVTESQGTELDYKSFDKAFVMVEDTSETLYKVFLPLATAATGVYLVSKSTESPRNSQEDDDE